MIVAGRFMTFGDNSLFSQVEVENKIVINDYCHIVEHDAPSRAINLETIVGEVGDMVVKDGAAFAKIHLFTTKGFNEQRLVLSEADKIATAIEHGIPMYIHPFGWGPIEESTFGGVYIDDIPSSQGGMAIKKLSD